MSPRGTKDSPPTFAWPVGAFRDSEDGAVLDSTALQTSSSGGPKSGISAASGSKAFAGGGCEQAAKASDVPSPARTATPSNSSNAFGIVKELSPQSWRRKLSNSGHSLDCSILAAAEAGSPRPTESAGKERPSLQKRDSAAALAFATLTSPLKIRDMSSASGRWLRSSPLAPPASKAAAMRRNIGSLCSSASMLDCTRFASFFSRVLTPQIRLFLVGFPSSPGCPSSFAMSAEFNPPSTR
mmetsp:Transcript_15990/g.37977  ORF Transcript_15990/g.37977 Transcript_15990/m.37977 type:complete len:240 (-) Transcript_15990:359-1078(-)